jgi:protoporphyrinogen oxidase
MSKNYTDFLIVGAGLSGLACARDLKKKGFTVRLIEKSPQVGGRLAGYEGPDYFSDTGAQFLSSNYVRIRKLLKELKIEDELTQSPDLLGIYQNKSYRQISTTNPLSMLKIFSFKSFIKLALTLLRMKSIQEMDLENISYWGKRDQENAKAWCLKNLDKDLHDLLLEPIISGFNYASTEVSSSYLVERNLGYFVWKGKVIGLKSGLPNLAQRLALDLDIMLDEEVQSIEVGKTCRVTTSKDEYQTKKIIFATTASVARNLHPSLSEAEKKILSVSYGSSIQQTFLFKGRTSKVKAYGTMLIANPFFNVLTLERLKNPASTPKDSELIHLLTSQQGYEFGVRYGLDLLKEEGLKIIEEITGLKELIHHHVVSWAEAIPQSPTGHAHLVSEYRLNISKDDQLFLTGDYLGTPCTEGAIEAGQFLASRF